MPLSLKAAYRERLERGEIKPDAAQQAAVEALEATFRDMDSACAVEWGHARPAADSSTWLLLGALNLAHRVARLEREATQHTQDLE